MNSLIHGPKHILNAIKLFKRQSKEIQDIIRKPLSRGAYHAHPENLLLALQTSSDGEDRVFAVDRILQLRRGNEFGDKSVRYHKTPEINFNCEGLRDLIYWDKTACYEPIFTCNLSRDEIEEFETNPISVPDYPIHSQSTERAVQEVSKAALTVFGQEKRDGFVRARIAHREVLPVFASKKDVMQIF